LAVVVSTFGALAAVLVAAGEEFEADLALLVGPELQP
jgi:hypothetical protein